MKKLISAMLCLLLLLPSALAFASAEPPLLPFDIAAPQNAALMRLPDGGDSPTTLCFAYSIENTLMEFFIGLDNAENREAYLAPYGFSDIALTLQIDWAIDDVNDPVSGWHYNEFWNYNEEFGSFGTDDMGNLRVSDWDVVDCWTEFSESVSNVWILRGVPDDVRWNGNPETKSPGVKEQLRPDQYTYHDDTVWIDWAEHTAYTRARFVVTGIVYGSDRWEYLGASGWSSVASAGKDAEAYEPLTAADLPAPVIADLHMTDELFNANPVVAFTLTVPDDLAEKAARVSAAGGYICVFTEARVKGDTEWIEMGDTDREVRSGELECALLHLVNGERPSIPADTEIELRCRYVCSQPGLDDVSSEYSEIITFATDTINTGENPGGNMPQPPADPGAPDEPRAKCPLCGFCPRPLGLCIFIWLAILVVIFVIVILILKKKKGGKK